MSATAMLLRLARESIEASLLGGEVSLPDDPWLDSPRAVFVTLRQRRDGALRGCVGSIEPRTGLGEAVVDAARAAAFRDGRFTPLSHGELEDVRVEISVVSPLAPLPVQDEADACARLEQTRPGVVLTHGWRRGVFLPKVWSSIPDPAEFLQHLKMKAGLAPGFWSAAIRLDVFTCDEFAEPEETAAHLETS